uniref:Uncharacterized protein n=1 Tax=Mola mola TaxID=94237 RepID=A0A3Q3WJM1_MOLML
MSSDNSMPYGVKSLLECMCRAAVLAQLPSQEDSVTVTGDGSTNPS